MLRPHSYQPPENGLPPADVRILSLHAEPWPEDSHRVRIHLEITPFKERPNLEVTISDAEGDEVASVNIIESIDDRMVFTMHIRKPDITGQYGLAASIAYPEIGQVDQKNVIFAIPQKSE